MLHLIIKNKKSAPGSTAISAMGSSTFSVSVGADRTVPLLLDGTDLRKSYGSYNAEYIPKFFTLSPTLQNYVDAFTTVSLGRYLWNTLFFTVVTTAIMLVVITLAAFAFARLNFAGKI